jgi:hypothetical protein
MKTEDIIVRDKAMWVDKGRLLTGIQKEAYNNGYYGKCERCGVFFDLWMTSDLSWYDSRCEGIICRECYDKARKHKPRRKYPADLLQLHRENMKRRAEYDSNIIAYNVWIRGENRK